jgi:hypothetical protein
MQKSTAPRCPSSIAVADYLLRPSAATATGVFFALCGDEN